jgi:hypothetical protein
MIANAENSLLKNCRNQRHPQIGVERKLEAERHHADDGGRLSIDAHGAADHGWRSAIAVLPSGVSEQHHAGRARLSVGGGEGAAPDRRDVQQVEQAGSHALHRKRLRREVLIDEPRLVGISSLQSLERTVVGLELAILGVGEAAVATRELDVLHAHDHQPVAAANRDGLEEHGVGQREDHGVHADAAGNGRHNREGKPAAGQDHAQRKEKVVAHGTWTMETLRSFTVTIAKRRGRPRFPAEFGDSLAFEFRTQPQ